MLLDNDYTIVPSIRFTLTYDNGVRKVITVKTGDTIDCSYKKNGERFSITGVVAKIGCNFNSSLGAVGTTAYLQVDGSAEYSGRVEYIQPNQVLTLVVTKTSEVIENVVCSVDNEDQRITLIRENEVGVFQYSLDGLTWKAATGAQGMSAYECAVALGFEGTEEEWLESLKGQPGEPGETGALEIFKVYNSIQEAEEDRDNVPKNKLIAVTELPQTLLFVRTGGHRPCPCPCCNSDGEIVDDTTVQIIGYRYLGYLTVGPQGEPGNPGRPGDPGKDGKSAYDYAVEGGFPGTEEEFMRILGNSGVVVTNFYMGLAGKVLYNSVIGPIDLRIFGFTDVRRFKSVSVSKIDISCSSEPEDQSLIFPEEIILRAVPTEKESAKPNLVVNGRKYVADCIMIKNGVPGVFRRIRYIESYNGETIIGDWISSTGELDLGAQVQFVTYGRFEPFSEDIQSQYKKLHAFDNDTKIEVTNQTYISVSYPINVTKFIEEYTAEYLDEHGPEIIEPMVEAAVADKLAGKQDKLTPGANITIDENNVISSSANTTLGEPLVVANPVGGIAAGTVYSADTQISQIIKDMLGGSGPVPPPVTYKVYFGISTTVPESLEGLDESAVSEEDIVQHGISHRFTANDEHFVYVYPKHTGELISIKDNNGFEQIDGWNKVEIEDNGIVYYAYYTNETLTVNSYKITFIYTD